MLFLLFSFLTANAAMTELEAQKECSSRTVFVYRPADTKKDTEFGSKKECEASMNSKTLDAYSPLCTPLVKSGPPVKYKKWSAKVMDWPFGEDQEYFENKESCEKAVANGVPKVHRQDVEIAAKGAGGKHMRQFISDCFEDEIIQCGQ